jgi:tetratricopeptide (TPR) repeat protein
VSIVGFLCLLTTLALGQDLRIGLTDLTYNSDFEKTSFESYANSPDYFALLLAPDESVSADQFKKWKTSFEAQLEALRPEVEAKKKNDKKVKFLYEKIHSKFLTKYENINLFSQVFNDGVYNCVSATGLYSLVFDYFGIPYAIQEKPTHVYLVAYPSAERIQIETTTPVGGYYVFDQAFKQNYVKRLADGKLISSVEYKTKSTDELFDKHFFDNENIDLKKLIGIQYMNTGLYLLDKEETDKAYDQFQKSYYFYPTEKTKYMMYMVLLDAFQKLSYSNEKKAVYLSKICRFTKEGITDDMISAEFIRITQKLFIEDGKKETYDNVYAMLRESISDSVINNQIVYVYNYENGRVLYNQGHYPEAIPYFEEALKAKPNNVEMTALFVENLARLESPTTDKPAYILKLQDYAVKYPNLNKDTKFTALIAENMLEQLAKNFEQGSPKEGERYRLMFEEYVAKTKDINMAMIDRHIGAAYSVACAHYFKTGQKAKAKAVVDKGLSYAPYSYQLRSRKEMLR